MNATGVAAPGGPPPAVGGWPTISVIVPVLNGGEAVHRLAASLLAQDYPGPRPEILFVDNGSTDGTPERLAALPVTLLHESKRGAPAARNRGARAATSEILAFTDHDCQAERRWLKELVAAFRDPLVGGAAGETVATPSQSWAARYLAWIRHNSAEASLARPVFPFAATANFAVRRTLHEQLGGFDEALHNTDDVDFTFRLIRGAGARIAFVKRAIVFHEERIDGDQLARRYRQYGAGWCGLVLKHPSELRWHAGRALAADWDVARAGLRAAAGWVRWRILRRKPETFEFARYEFLRRRAHRAGFRAEARRHGHWTW